jgi:16S rRNA (adenine1518-N6/adenine1519-N6)-dimethyltransferase
MGSRYQPFAKRSLGQNFLVDGAVIDRIVHALDPKSKDTVVEIGPGRGALTEKLIERAGTVYALELDTELSRLLREKFAERPHVHILETDALLVDFSEIAEGRKLRLVANLPYNVSTAILQRLFSFGHNFEDCVLMFQREVVDRITAPHGSKDRGYLSVLTQAYFIVEKLFDVPPSAFKPIPKVWSSVVRCVPRNNLVFDHAKLEAILSLSFSQKRKTILNNLKQRYVDAETLLSNAGIDPQRRAETLTLEEWLRLIDAAGPTVTS